MYDVVVKCSNDPVTAPNPVYDVVVKCSNDPVTADNPVYGVRIGVTTIYKLCHLSLLF